MKWWQLLTSTKAKKFVASISIIVQDYMGPSAWYTWHLLHVFGELGFGDL
jgi:hypothetical protein